MRRRIDCVISKSEEVSRSSNVLLPAISYDHTLVLAIELSKKNWVLAAQVPGLPQTKAQRTIEAEDMTASTTRATPK
jgi:hypothetical protein